MVIEAIEIGVIAAIAVIVGTEGVAVRAGGADATTAAARGAVGVPAPADRGR